MGELEKLLLDEDMVQWEPGFGLSTV